MADPDPETPANADFHAVTDAELGLLKILWTRGKSTPRELQEELGSGERPPAYTTVQTLLHRLLKKGYVERERSGTGQVYRALLDREDVLLRHMDDLAQRVCDGATTPLVLSLVNAGRFSPGEIARFREILDRAEAFRRGPDASGRD